MKKKYLILLVLVSLFTACSDDDDNQNLNTIETITTLINGQSVEFKISLLQSKITPIVKPAINGLMLEL